MNPQPLTHLILSDLSQSNGEKRLEDILDQHDVAHTATDVAEIAGQLQEGKYIRCDITKDGCFATITLEGRAYLRSLESGKLSHILRDINPAINPDPNTPRKSSRKLKTLLSAPPKMIWQIISVLIALIFGTIMALRSCGKI